MWCRGWHEILRELSRAYCTAVQREQQSGRETGREETARTEVCNLVYVKRTAGDDSLRWQLAHRLADTRCRSKIHFLELANTVPHLAVNLKSLANGCKCCYDQSKVGLYLQTHLLRLRSSLSTFILEYVCDAHMRSSDLTHRTSTHASLSHHVGIGR